ncbi:MAG TPA: translation elongation factor Ts [Polyangiaceae bacterium]
MAEVTASMVKELRERTQAGMSDCKNALVEAGGDMEKAVEIILKKGLAKAASRSGRVATEGQVATWVAPDGKRGVIIEINTQTDFASRDELFQKFAKDVLQVASKAPKGADLGAQTYPGTDKTVEFTRAELSAKTGENIVLRRWGTVEAKEPNSLVHAYVHPGGKLAVLVHAEGPDTKNADFKTFVDNVAMQVAAMNPMVVRKEEITPAAKDKQKEIYEAQMKEEKAAGTLKAPEQAWPKIIEGKLGKWFTEVTLLAQDNVWDPPAGSIDAVRQAVSKQVGGEVKIHAFLRYSLGEGIEKKTEDFAAEVAKTVGG